MMLKASLLSSEGEAKRKATSSGGPRLFRPAPQNFWAMSLTEAGRLNSSTPIQAFPSRGPAPRTPSRKKPAPPFFRGSTRGRTQKEHRRNLGSFFSLLLFWGFRGPENIRTPICLGYLPHSFQGSFLSGNHQKPRGKQPVFENSHG